jgi:hypothetical protein
MGDIAKWAGVAVALGVATAAHADPTTVTTQVAIADPVRVPVLGVMADVGLPDAGTVSAVVRPIRALRLELGVAHDYIGPGVRGGVTWIPLKSWATPTLGVAYGHFFDRDANSAAREISGDPTISSPLLQRVGYDFAVARAGIELGRQRFTFFLHAGITRVTAQVHNVAEASNQAAQSSGSMVTVTSTDPNITVWTASVDLGFVVYLF